MATGFDELVEQLLYDVALAGSHGIGVAELAKAVENYYESRNQQYSLERPTAPTAEDLLFSDAPPTTAGRIDAAFTGTIWDWLSQHPDIEVHDVEDEDDWANVRQQDSSNDAHDFSSAPRSAKQRIFTSKDRTWQAVAGHGVDHQRLPPMYFECLSVIAAHGPSGILQPELRRLTGQDKRSLPHRTDVLAQRGYISEVQALGKQALGAKRDINTTLLTLRRFEKDRAKLGLRHARMLGEVEGGGEAIAHYDAWLDKMIELLKTNDNIIVIADLLIGLELYESQGRTKTFRRAYNRLVKSGCIRKLSARVDEGVDDANESWVRCIQLLREPTGDDRACFVKTGGRKRSTKRLHVHEHDNHPSDESEEEQVVEPDDSTLVELDQSVQVPQWTPDLPYPNFLYNIISSAGPSGIGSMDLHEKATGNFWRRPLEELMLRLTDAGEQPQPVHLNHLQIVRNAGKRSRLGQYTFRVPGSYEKVTKAVSGDHQAAAKQKGRPRKITEMDAWGFPQHSADKFAGPDGRASLFECQDVTGLVAGVEEDISTPGRKPSGRAKRKLEKIFATPAKKRKMSMTNTMGPDNFVGVSFGGRHSDDVDVLTQDYAAAAGSNGIRNSTAPTITGGESASIFRASAPEMAPLEVSSSADDGISTTSRTPASKLPKATGISTPLVSATGIHINPRGSYPPHLIKPGRRRGAIVAVFKSSRLSSLPCFSPAPSQLPRVKARRTVSDPAVAETPAPAMNVPSSGDAGRPAPATKRTQARAPLLSSPGVVINPDGSYPAHLAKTTRGRPKKAIVAVFNSPRLASLPCFVRNASQAQLDETTPDQEDSYAKDQTLPMELNRGASPERPVERNDISQSKKRAREDEELEMTPNDSPFTLETPIRLPKRTKRGRPSKVEQAERERMRAQIARTTSAPVVNSMKATTVTGPQQQARSRLMVKVPVRVPPDRGSTTFSAVTGDVVANGSEPQQMNTELTSTSPASDVQEPRNIQLVVKLPVSNALQSSEPENTTVRQQEFRSPSPRTRRELSEEGGRPLVNLPGLDRAKRCDSQLNVDDIHQLSESGHRQEGLTSTAGSPHKSPSIHTEDGELQAQTALEEAADLSNTPVADQESDHVDSDDELPELQNSDAASTQLQRQREDCIVKIVQDAGGAHAGKDDLYRPFSQRWREQYKQKPDRDICRRTTDILVHHGKLKKLQFVFDDAESNQVKRYVITNPDMDPNSSAVQDVQREIIRAYPYRKLSKDARLEKVRQDELHETRNLSTPDKTTTATEALNSVYQPVAPASEPVKHPGRHPDEFPIVHGVKVKRTARAIAAAQQEQKLWATPKQAWPVYKRVVFSKRSWGRGADRLRNVSINVDDTNEVEDDTDEDDSDTYEEGDDPAADDVSEANDFEVNHGSPATPASFATTDDTHEESDDGSGTGMADDDTEDDNEDAPVAQATMMGSFQTTNYAHDPSDVETRYRVPRPRSTWGPRSDKALYISPAEGGLPPKPPKPTTRPRRPPHPGVGPRGGGSIERAVLMRYGIKPPKGPTDGTSRTSTGKTAASKAWAKSSAAPNSLAEILLRAEILGRHAPETDKTLFRQFRYEISSVWHVEDVVRKSGSPDGLAAGPDFINHGLNRPHVRPALDEDEEYSVCFVDGFIRAGQAQKRKPRQSVKKPAREVTTVRAASAQVSAKPTNTLRQPSLMRQGSTRSLLLQRSGASISASQPKPLQEAASNARTPYNTRGQGEGRPKLDWSAGAFASDPPSETQTPKATPPRYVADGERQPLAIAIALCNMLCGGAGRDGRPKWEIVAHILSYKCGHESYRAKWRSQSRGPLGRLYVEKLEAALREPFLEAYEMDQLPTIDFSRPQDTDWPVMLKWAQEKLVSLGVLAPVAQKPGRRQSNTSGQDVIADGPDDDLSQGAFSAFGSAINAELDNNAIMEKSWVRALTATAPEAYDEPEATCKLLSIDTYKLKTVIDEMQRTKTLTHVNKGRQQPGRNFVLTPPMLSQFNRWPGDNGNRSFLTELASTWISLVGRLQSYHKLELRPDVSETEMMILNNLLANGQVRITPVLPPMTDDFDAPPGTLSTWGMGGYSHKPKTSDESAFQLSVVYTKTAKFSTEHDLRRDVPPPTFVPAGLGDAGSRIPLWVDIHNNFIPKVWRMVLRSVLHLLVHQPGVTAKMVEKAHASKLWTWEVELVLEWMEKVGLGVRCGAGKDAESSRNDGWRAGEWWFCAFAPDVAG